MDFIIISIDSFVNLFQAETMDQWVTNSFYTSFPSFKNQDLNTNTLADDRREEYKKYLAEVSHSGHHTILLLNLLKISMP